MKKLSQGKNFGGCNNETDKLIKGFIVDRVVSCLCCFIDVHPYHFTLPCDSFSGLPVGCLAVPSALLARSRRCNCKEIGFSEAGPGGGVGEKEQSKQEFWRVQQVAR